MKLLLPLFTVLSLAVMGCSRKEEAAAAPSPAPMQMNGQNVPSEGAHYVQQMQQRGQQVPNGGR